MVDNVIKGENAELPRFRVDESETYRQLAVREPTLRERTAARIACSILALFGVSLFGAFAVGIYLLSKSQGAVDQPLIEVSLAYLKTIGTLFTPLLGFILGYYFTKKED
jgi:hypothetical protein